MAFRPYLLNPELEGKQPVPKVRHLEEKLGKPFAEMRSVQQLRADGEAYGLRYRFGAEDLASGSVDSHRVLQYIATVGGTEAAQVYRREIMRRFNEEGAALSSRELLLGAVEVAGEDTEVAESVLDSAAYRMDVTWMDRETKKSGINMVPHYRFHTPAGLHSIADYYEEWHFLDAIYRSFPSQQQWSNWEEASQAARAAVDALDALKGLQRGLRRGEAVAEESLQEAAEAAEAGKEGYRRRFLAGAAA